MIVRVGRGVGRVASRYQRGDRVAAERLLRSHAGLIRKIAVALSLSSGCLELEDLLIEGQMGLLAAAESFDPRRGLVFSTSATVAVRRHVRRAIFAQGSMIRRPEGLCERQAKLRCVRRRLAERLGRDPVVEEIAAEMGCSSRVVQRLVAAEVAVTSLEAPVGEGEGCDTWGELLAASGDLAESVAVQLTAAWALSLETLTPQERQAIRLRYGFVTGKPLSYREVGLALGVSLQWARALECSALGKMREACGVSAGPRCM
jgi:RNA polymerase primary sigma factor